MKSVGVVCVIRVGKTLTKVVTVQCTENHSKGGAYFARNPPSKKAQIRHSFVISAFCPKKVAHNSIIYGWIDDSRTANSNNRHLGAFRFNALREQPA